MRTATAPQPASSSSRLPNSAQLPSRGAQVALGLGALVGTVAIVVGVPILMLAAFGTPWPDQKPSMEWLTSPTTGEAVLGVLAVVVWLAWLHFVVCLVVEAVAERRRRGMAPHVPGGGIGTQALARRAIATIALIAGTTAATLGPATAAVSPGHAAAPSVAAAAANAPVSTHATSQAPTAHRAATQRNVALAADDLVEATAHDVAAGATTYYEVRPPRGRHYDTMWDIAERYLGSGVRYKEIWDLNRGLEQADGRVLRDADLIQPGWVLRLPSDAKGPGLKVVSHATDGMPGSTTSGAHAESASAHAGATSSAGGVGTTASTDSVSEAAKLFDGAWSPLFGVAGGLALAGAFLARRRRRAAMTTRQLWTEAFNGTPPPTDPGTDPDPDGPGPGAQLRDEADPDTASWLDNVLRSLGTTSTPAQAWVSNAGLVLGFDDPPSSSAPKPWEARGDRAWTLARDAVDGDAARSGRLSAIPGLVCAGVRDDDAVLMLDPEATHGVVSLVGDEDVARGVATSMAVDTATHAWADTRTVTMVGFADDLTATGYGNLRRTDDLGRVLEELDNLARYQRNGCRTAGVDSVRRAREVAPTALDWRYHLVLCSGVPHADNLARLRDLAADPRVAVGVIVIGEVPDAAMVLTTRDDGRLVAPLHGIDVRAQVLSVAAGRQLAGLSELDEHGRTVTMEQLVDRLESSRPAASSEQARVRVGILGPVTVAAPGEVADERREFLTELACFLALHPRGVHANRISAALWPRGVDAEVRDSALQQLRAWFGVTADGSPVLAEASGVWRFAPGSVALDWDEFREDLNRSAESPSAAEQHLRAALDLVRGVAFEDAPAGRYSWLEADGIEADIALATVLTTLALAEKAAARSDVEAARSALARGLRLSPANEELWGSWLRLEATFGDREALAGVADQMYAAIAEHGSPMGASAETDALVAELLPGYRAAVA